MTGCVAEPGRARDGTDSLMVRDCRGDSSRAAGLRKWEQAVERSGRNSGPAGGLEELALPGLVVDGPAEEGLAGPPKVVEPAKRDAVTPVRATGDLFLGQVDRLAAEVQGQEGSLSGTTRGGRRPGCTAACLSEDHGECPFPVGSWTIVPSFSRRRSPSPAPRPSRIPAGLRSPVSDSEASQAFCQGAMSIVPCGSVPHSRASLTGVSPDGRARLR